MSREEIPKLIQARVYQDDALTDEEVVSIGSGSAVAVSVKSPNKESGNEDAALLRPLDERSSVLAVADGVGGHAAGAQASSLVMQTLNRYLRDKSEEQETREALLQGVEAANRAVIGLGIGAATTLSVVDIHGDRLQSFHIGDSLILVVGQKGKLKHQTIPHSPVGYAVEAGFLDEKEALDHEDRHLVSNIIGTEDMRVEMGPRLTLKERDTVFVCSDGVYDNMHMEELVEIIRAGDLKENAHRLTEEVMSRMKQSDPAKPSKPDDFTFVLFRLGS
ncbi:MAG: protein phosphatase 2C domain-containing protein [bacterium]|nr:protein phosphatase 2C domain-containing protein [bacterium]